MASLNLAKLPLMARHRGRLVKNLYDWMAHSFNLAKGAKEPDKKQASKCLLCDGYETQAHTNTSCSHSFIGANSRNTYFVLNTKAYHQHNDG